MPTSRLAKFTAAFVAINLGLILYAHAHRPAAGLTVTFLDVGQGDAAVIQTPGGRTMLIDTGPNSERGGQDQGRLTVEPFLRHQGVNHVDVILLTHPHADHIGGADTLLDDIPTDLLIDNGEPTEPPLEQQVYSDARRLHVAYKPAAKGQTLDFGDGVTAQLLAPTRAEVLEDVPNNASIVVRLTYGRTTFLFAGDAEAPEEQEMLAEHKNVKCDVLKVGHHGSDTSSTLAFLNAARPREAVISVGTHNHYGHPSRSVIARLEQIGAHVDRTDQNGAVICTSDGDTVHVETVKQ